MDYEKLLDLYAEDFNAKLEHLLRVSELDKQAKAYYREHLGHTARELIRASFVLGVVSEKGIL